MKTLPKSGSAFKEAVARIKSTPAAVFATRFSPVQEAIMKAEMENFRVTMHNWC